MAIVVIRYETRTAARRALTFVVRIFVNHTIAIASRPESMDVTDSRHSTLRVGALSDGLALVFTLIEGLGLRQITARILHELALRIRAAEAVGLALDSRIHRAIRLHVLVVGKTPATHVAEFPSSCIGRGAKSNHERDRKHGGVNPRHRNLLERVGPAHEPPRLPPQRTPICSVPAADGHARPPWQRARIFG